ncbi:trehalose synthase [Geomonas limicola]|uniref:Maltokinase n=1 Tax=Geomonas limicola TaxID=2740186 RepID=A0A6V8N516_9BACT|nr:maltose alpha-D-glucosyltransferase [Geomonas limicola]GFO67662.1 trehalose synthase [Geomonas limicola]
MPTRGERNPLWFKDAIIYEVHVRSFCDSNGDGIGDFRGLLSKLPYLRDLGVTAIWVLPFYPSPLRDDGYDIADYRGIHPDYGTLRDFQDFLRGAHQLGMRVITELVLNHTSDQHPWFQKARHAKPGSPWRDFYVWSDTPDRYADARIIFKDFETSNWSRDPVAKSYFWHRFYAHQPDLNFDNPRVHDALFRVIDFWLGMGVDGLRLDAVPYLYEREGTNCENLPETYQFLKKLRAYLDQKYPDRMLLAEANQWPEDAASYFGGGAACHMAFHFPLMPRMFMAVQMEDSFPIINILQQTPTITQECQWALFLRNHDELTLEMVTDEERDYMYRIYARDPRARINLGIRRRLAPLMGDDRQKIELMNVLLFTLPGTPIIYYGDEIGMGDNYYLGDRNGVRTPMQWSADRNAGFSPCNPQGLYLPVIIDPEYHYEAINVENQAKNPSSLLWWMKRLIDLRKRYKAFGWGSVEFITLDNPKILVMLRKFEEQTILVLVNLSRSSQYVQINHPRFTGMYPEDMLGRTKFPAIKDAPYVVIVGPYGYHLMLLTQGEEKVSATPRELAVRGSWEQVFSGAARRQLEQGILSEYLKKCRWFQGKSRIITHVVIAEQISFELDGSTAQLTVLEVTYSEGSAENYLLPLHFLPLETGGDALVGGFPWAVVTTLEVDGKPGVLYDALANGQFRQQLLALIARRKALRTDSGRLYGRPSPGFSALLGERALPLASLIGKGEQSNSAVLYDETFFLKIYRRMEEGTHPEVEIGKFLGNRTDFEQLAPMAGQLEYHRAGREPVTLALLQGFVASQGDAWTFTLGEVTQFLDRVLAHRDEVKTPALPDGTNPPAGETAGLAPELLELMRGFYAEMVGVLGRRTAEFHLALASRGDDPSFAPEPFGLLYQRSVYQSMRSRTKKTLDLLRRNVTRLAKEHRADALGLLDHEQEILAVLHRFTSEKFLAMKTRTHGDYHLGQVLYTGKDFVIIDFEGEPVKSLTERRLKQSPLRDVAGMMRSFFYAPYAVLMQRSQIRAEDIPYLIPWAETWYRYNAGIFLASYLKQVEGAGLIPKDPAQVDVMLQTFMLDKAVYELGYELNNRPDWVSIPIRGILGLLNLEGGKPKGEGAGTAVKGDGSTEGTM